MKQGMNRRNFLLAMASIGIWPQLGLAKTLVAAQGARVGAAWRGPNASDTYYAGALLADWSKKKVEIRYAVPLPTRPHGLIPEADGGLLVIGVRPGGWMLRCDGEGKEMQRVQLDAEPYNARLNGHAAFSLQGDVLFATETDMKTGRGKISVRDRQTLKKLEEWDSHGVEPHQLVLDGQGNIIVANGGVPRTPSDKKYDLHRMESSLARIDSRSGKLLQKWQLQDQRLSLRHLAWSQPKNGSSPSLGIAMQAEHDDPAVREAAPVLAVLDGDTLSIPSRDQRALGYSGDISPAFNGGFAISSNKAGLAQLWLPGSPDRLTPIVELEEAYATAAWAGPANAGGVLVATALGLVRWHPTAPPLFLAWPKPMALDNHWVLLDEV